MFTWVHTCTLYVCTYVRGKLFHNPLTYTLTWWYLSVCCRCSLAIDALDPSKSASCWRFQQCSVVTYFPLKPSREFSYKILSPLCCCSLDPDKFPCLEKHFKNSASSTLCTDTQIKLMIDIQQKQHSLSLSMCVILFYTRTIFHRRFPSIVLWTNQEVVLLCLDKLLAKVIKSWFICHKD